MPLIPAKNPEKGEIYIFKNDTQPDRTNGHEVLITSDFDSTGYATGADLNDRCLVGVYKSELFEKSTHIYEVGDIVEDLGKGQKGRFFQVLELLNKEDYYKTKCVRNTVDSASRTYEEGSIQDVLLCGEDGFSKDRLFIKGSLLK